MSVRRGSPMTLQLRPDLQPNRRRAAPEQALQQTVALYLNRVLAPSVVWSSIGHGGGGKVRGAILKAGGLLPGVADVAVFYEDSRYMGRFNVLWIELKSKIGRVSAAQICFAHRVEALNHKYYVCRTLEDVELSLDRSGVPMRGKLT